MLPSHIPFRESSIDPSPVPGRKKRPEIWIVLSVSQVLRLVDLQPCIESIGMLTSDELRHADKSQRWHRNHSGDERVADAPRLSSPIPRKSHLRRAGWDYGGVDGRDRAARRQAGTLPRVTVGAVGQAGLSPDSPSVRGLGFPARHRAATSAPSCRSCPNRALFESCTSPRFARSADHIRSHSCIPPLYKHLYKHHRRLTRRMFRGHPSLCAGRVTLCDPAPSDAMTKTLAITGLWGYRHCARGRAA